MQLTVISIELCLSPVIDRFLYNKVRHRNYPLSWQGLDALAISATAQVLICTSMSLLIVLLFLILGVIGRVADPVMLMHAVIDKLVPVMKVQEGITLPLFFHGGCAFVRVVVAWQGEGRVG